MKRNLIVLLILFFSVNSRAQPLPVKLKHTVIIDTDCAIDDMRSISILLALPEITVKAILLSDNALKYWLEWDRNKIFDVVEIMN